MNIFSWADYEDTEITEKTKYWIDLWEEIIDNFSTNSHDTELVNPHLLLMNLVDEIKYNNLKSKQNNDYFLKKVGFYIKNDAVIKSLFKADFQLIISELSSPSKRFEYFILLCEQTINSFRKGIYFKESCDLLKKTILAPTWLDIEKEKKEILYISQSLIIELILAGYSIKEIGEIPLNLFEKYHVSKTNRGEDITTKYPLSFTPKDFYEHDIFDETSYNKAVKAEIDSLSISDRVDRLKYYFDKEPFEGYGIFHIQGLKGNIDVNIGDVNFYSPDSKEKVQLLKSTGAKAKTFDEKKLMFYDETCFINAAVKIKYLDFESAKTHALNIIEKSLDVLRLHIYSEIPFGVSQHKFHLVNSKTLRTASSFSLDKDKANNNYNDVFSFDLSDSHFFSGENEETRNSLERLLFSENIEKYSLSSKLIFSLHWYRKAFETNIVEDKLLNYWIVIESLITFDSKNENMVLKDKEERNKFILVEEIVPFIELSNSIKNVAVDAYSYFKCVVHYFQVSDFKKLTGSSLNIPGTCLDACQLRLRGEKINLKEFVKELPALSPYLIRKVHKDKIEYIDKFYNDVQFTQIELQRKLEQTKQDLLLIYRYRNLIVHNARFDNNILPYYVSKAENLAKNLLREVFDQYIRDSSRSHQEILLWKKVKMERIIERLNNHVHVDLLDI